MNNFDKVDNSNLKSCAFASLLNSLLFFLIFFLLSVFLFFFKLEIFKFENIFGCFDTSRSMTPLSVSQIHCTRGFCDEQDEQQDEELGILVVGFSDPIESCCARKQ